MTGPNQPARYLETVAAMPSVAPEVENESIRDRSASVRDGIERTRSNSLHLVPQQRHSILMQALGTDQSVECVARGKRVAVKRGLHQKFEVQIVGGQHFVVDSDGHFFRQDNPHLGMEDFMAANEELDVVLRALAR